MSGEARIQIDVPLATPFEEIKEMIFRQAWERSGSQLRAAFHLGTTPERISRFLCKRERERLARSENRSTTELASMTQRDMPNPDSVGITAASYPLPPSGNPPEKV